MTALPLAFSTAGSPSRRLGRRSEFLAGRFLLLAGCLSFLAALFGLFPAPPICAAQENTQWSRMLDGLKGQERGYFDTALQYLEWMKDSPMAPPSLKERYDFEVALVHMGAIENQKMFLKFEEHLKLCREALEKYIREHPEGGVIFEARMTLGRLYQEEGRIKMLTADLDVTREENKKQLREQAREDYKKSQPIFNAVRDMAREPVVKLQKEAVDNPNSVDMDALNTARGRYLVALESTIQAKAYIAKTYPADSKEFKDGINAAVNDYLKMAKDYVSFKAGFDAKLSAAVLLKDLGDFKRSRELLGELNTLSGDAFMDILTQSLLLALEMNLIEKKPENYQDSINRARGWSDTVGAAAKISYDGQRIFLLGARNFIEYSKTQEDNRQEKDRALRDAGVFLRQVRNTYPPLYREARDLLEQIGAVQVDRSNPENYQQAKEFADEQWNEFVLLNTQIQDAKNDEERQEIQGRIAENARLCADTIHRAVAMREEGTPIAEINSLRFNLARLYMTQGRYLEAAVMLDFMARRYSSGSNATDMAKLAIQLYRTVYVNDKIGGYDTTAVGEQLDKLAAFILVRWDGQPEVTGEVQLVQIETAIDAGNLAEAKKLLEATAEGTAQRVSAELKLGLSLWNRYASLVRLPDGADDKPTRGELDDMQTEAKKQLETGLRGKLKLLDEGKGRADSISIQGAMTLGQMSLDRGDSKQAIDWLNNPKIGPLALADEAGLAPNLKTLVDGLRINALMFVLRAYVGNEELDKAEETMNRLEKAIKDEGADDTRLTQIYVLLGRQLENRLKDLSESGDAEQAEKVAKGFELFLNRIGGRGDNSFQIMYWIADTFYRLGSGLSSDKNVPEEAKDYFRSAAKTYTTILQRIEDDREAGTEGDARWAPERAGDTIKTRLAESLRAIGLYEASLNYLNALLEEENRIAIQIEAARTLEAWGKIDNQKTAQAVVGGFPSRAVIGWNGLLRQTRNNIDRFSDFYYEAYLGKFRCAIEMARIAEKNKDDKRKDSLLENAYNDFGTLISQRPQLGGPEWFALFDQQFKILERMRGEQRPKGLRELQKTVAAQAQQIEVADVEAGVRYADKSATAPPTGEEGGEAGEGGEGATAAKKTPPKTDYTLMIACGLVVLFIPVAAFLVFGKKRGGKKSGTKADLPPAEEIRFPGPSTPGKPKSP